MYNSDLYVKAITYQNPESIPVTFFIQPSVWFKYPEEIRELSLQYPDFFENPGVIPDFSGWTTYHIGDHTDEWGCVWSNLKDGQESLVTGHPVKTREDIRNLKIPGDRTGRTPHGLMYLRLLDLRGFEEAMIDFAEEPPELQIFIDKVLEYNLIQFDIAIQKNKSKVQVFGDDLGMQTGLAIGREKWIKYLKPCFSAIFDKIHKAGKLAFFHTDGCVYEIVDELKDAGADMLELQYRANGLENIVRTCKGKISVNFDFDRQYFPFATPEGIDAHVKECVEAMYMKEGGLGMVFSLDDAVPLPIIKAAAAAAEKYRYWN